MLEIRVSILRPGSRIFSPLQLQISVPDIQAENLRAPTHGRSTARCAVTELPIALQAKKLEKESRHAEGQIRRSFLH